MGKLSNRLLTIEKIVPNANTVADIGCDHGYLAISLALSGKVKKAIASDVALGPLERAKNNIFSSGVSGVETRISDGFEAFSPGEVDVFIIAGMGGDLILEILKKHPLVWENSILVLSPHTHAKKVREYLFECCFIDAEDMVFEENKYYPIIRVRAKGYQKEKIDKELAIRFGPRLLEEKNDILKQYLIYQQDKYNKILSSLPEGSSRKREIKSELKLIYNGRKLVE